MKKAFARILCGLLCIILLVSFSYSQARKYERKSVTSLGSVLLKGGVDKKIVEIVNNRLKYHLEVPRFDYNQISQEAVANFVDAANNTDLSPENIAKAMESTIIPNIQKVLESVRELRAQGNLKEEDVARAAVDKMKGTGLTYEDVLKVMNSAYVYLPVVTSYTEEIKEEQMNAKVTGYVLWYHLVYGDAGMGATIVPGSKEVFDGMGDGKVGENYKLKKRSVEGKEYAMIIAVNTWAKNLAVSMKKIPDFKLSAEVMGVVGSNVEARLGTKEGIGLDDGFNIVDTYETDKGETKTEEIGFYRASKVVNNTSNPNELSTFHKYLGKKTERGMIIAERPRLGIDATLRMKYSSIKMPVADWGFLFTEDVTSAIGLDLQFQYNLAKMTNISQFFVNVEGGVGFISPNVKTGVTVSTPILYDVYLTVSKKFWMGSLNAELGAGYGYNAIYLKETNLNDEYTFNTYGLKVDASLNMLLSSDLIVGAYASYKVTSNIEDYEMKTSSGTTFTGTITNSETNFTGLSFGICASYALPSLPFDPFAFLSAGEIDY